MVSQIKLALGIEYDGSLYCGWQKQKSNSSIQIYVENALSKITSQSITVFCAGRTDAGVHALGQVVHFETDVYRKQSAWTLGVNRYLPNTIRVRWVISVHKGFHARHSAISRRYFYIIYNDCIKSSVLFGKVWHYKKLLDVYKMYKASQCLIGENDFSAFVATGCQSVSAKRKIYHLNVVRKGRLIIIDIVANAFIYRMVRNIVGSLVEVGSGKRSESWILELLRNGDRSLAGVTAPANGLYLAEVKYPIDFCIPSDFIDRFRIW